MKQEAPRYSDAPYKITVNKIELQPYPPNTNPSTLSIDNYDQLQRKTKLLEQRMTTLENTKVDTWNRLYPVFNIIAILSLSGMQLGYGIIQITTVYDQVGLLNIYGFGKPIGLAIGSMVAFMPFGAFFGSVFSKIILSKLSIKNAHHAINVLCMISSFALMQITVSGTLLAGRFFYGFCIACYCNWSPRYIHDLAPVNMKNFTRSVYSLWVVGAMVLGYFFGLIFSQNNVNNYFRVMFCFPGILALIQLIMMIIFVPHSPSQLYQKQEYEEGRKVLEKIYSAQFIDIMVDKYKLQAEVKSLQQTVGESPERYHYSKFRARFMSIYLSIFRQFAGINTIIIYASLITTSPDNNIGPYANFVLALLTFAATICSHCLLTEKIGRRLAMLAAAVVYTICNILIMIGMLVSNNIIIFVAMMMIMLLFGLTYSIVHSIYPSQILKNQQVTYTTLTAWPAMLLVTLLPPVIADVVSPTHTPWPLFLFYAIFSGMSVLYLWYFAVESKDRKYYDIIKQF